MNVDISDQVAVANAWKEIIKKHGRVNILVNNAARALGKWFSELQVETFKKTMDINFTSIV